VIKRIAGIVRGLAAGLSGEVGVPGAVKITYDLGKVMETMPASEKPEQPQSPYLAAYENLHQAMEKLTSGGATRVVIFVDDLDRCLPCRAGGLPGEQRKDFTGRVAEYLQYVAVRGQVNPREIKRFLNAYTLQGLIRDDLQADIVLALQVLAFRDEWRPLYDALLSSPKRFLDALNRYRQQKDVSAFEDISPGLDLAATGLS